MMRFKLTAVTATIIGLIGAFGTTFAVTAAQSGELQATPVAAAAPEFRGISHWLNSGPLTLAGLRGKVVLVDFWTYGCYNCVNTLPHVTALQRKFGGRGFTVVGVHTPEFPFEKSTANVEAAIRQHGITYPVAQDNGFATWNAYGNQYWPAQYILDKSGRVVYQHAGEGQYDQMDRIIAGLLGASS